MQDVVLEVGQLQGLAVTWSDKLHVLAHVVHLELVKLQSLRDQGVYVVRQHAVTTVLVTADDVEVELEAALEHVNAHGVVGIANNG